MNPHITDPQPNCPHCQNPSAEQDRFKRQVSDRDQDVDPNKEYDWFSITLGWALANNYKPEAAHTFAVHIRYHTDLG